MPQYFGKFAGDWEIRFVFEDELVFKAHVHIEDDDECFTAAYDLHKVDNEVLVAVNAMVQDALHMVKVRTLAFEALKRLVAESADNPEEGNELPF